MKIKLVIVNVLLLSSAVMSGQIRQSEPIIPVYPQLDDSESFSMIMFGDPQSYVKFSATQPLFDLQTAWIAQNAERLNVMTALITGDLVEQNNKLIAGGLPNFQNGTQTSRQQWEAISHSLSYLDGKVPYIACQGNHDIGYISAEHRYSQMPDYIYPERNPENMKHLVATAPNWQNIHTLENAAFEFNDVNWGRLLIVAMEFAPRDEILQWASDLISKPEYADHKVIIFVHSFILHDGTRIKSEKYKVAPCNWPQAVWDKLVYPSKNIALVLCGHTGVPPKITAGSNVCDIDYSCTCGFRVDAAADGHLIPQMMFNSQTNDGQWYGNGGDCWLRILEFKPDGRTVSVRTFSPLFAISPISASQAWRTAPYDQFEFTIDSAL